MFERKVIFLWVASLGTHWLAHVGAYLEVAGPLRVQLIPEVDSRIYGNLGIVRGGVHNGHPRCM